MSAQEEVIVDRLVRVIQRIQLDRGTGTLTAIRGEDTTFESGTIIFVKGKIVQANIGGYSHPDALNRLSLWNTCRITFVPASSEEENSLQGRSLSPSPEQSFPLMERKPLFSPGDKHTNPLRERQATPIPPGWEKRVAENWNSTRFHHSNWAVPRRLKPTEEALSLIEQRSLSRTHRHLFLLVDGIRTIPELAHILRRDEQDIDKLLLVLETLGCITRALLDH